VHQGRNSLPSISALPISRHPAAMPLLPDSSSLTRVTAGAGVDDRNETEGAAWPGGRLQIMREAIAKNECLVISLGGSSAALVLAECPAAYAAWKHETRPKRAARQFIPAGSSGIAPQGVFVNLPRVSCFGTEYAGGIFCAGWTF